MSEVAEQPTVVAVEMSPQQVEILASEAKIQWIGTGTKTGKTTVLAGWAADGVQRGEKVGWCGPWAKRTRTGYMLVKDFLKYDAQIGECKFNDSNMRVEHKSGGSFEPFTGDNPEAIFGDGFSRFIIDEASRQSQSSLTNALTTVSATDGQVKLAFNLEHGISNWAVEGFLRVQAMSPRERAEAGEAFLFMTTAEGGYVAPSVIERMRTKMPRALFEALYEGKIPRSDVALFHNLDEIFSGPAYGPPRRDRTYVGGIDLARKANYTVFSVLDVTELDHVKLAAATRFNAIDWTLQYTKLAEFAKLWNVSKSWVDASGIGDPVVPELEARGMKVEPFQFTERSRRELIEGLVIACDARAFRASDSEEFQNHKHEMLMFGYELDQQTGKVRYAARENEHDDCVMSLGLAWHGKQHGAFGQPRYERVMPMNLSQRIATW